MKKILLIFILSFILNGCSNEDSVNEEMRKQAANDISTALEKRWEITSVSTDKIVGAEQGVKTELEILDKYSNYSIDDYNDIDLYLVVDLYVRELENGLRVIKSYDLNTSSGAEKWSEHQAKRALKLSELNELIPLAISKDNETFFNEVLSYGKELIANEKIMSSLKESFDDLDVSYSDVVFDNNNIIVYLDDIAPLSEEEFVKSYVSDSINIIQAVKNTDYSQIAIVRNVDNVNDSILIGSITLFEKKSTDKLHDSISIPDFYSTADAYRINSAILSELDNALKTDLVSVKEGSSDYELFNELSSSM